MTDHGVEQRVHPCLVPEDRPIAAVNDVTNAIVVETDEAGRIVLEGPGAGQLPTASAVMADLVDLARGHVQLAFTVPAESLKRISPSPVDHRVGAYYLHLTALDKPGVMAVIAEDLAEEGVSLESIIQRGAEHRETVPIILVTHECRESVMKRALARIDAHDSIVQPPRMIRIEPL
jgi:homoserine dehydrogenase